MSDQIQHVMSVYLASDAEATRRLYAELSVLGPAGQLAVNVLRACKKSERAKVYRGAHYRRDSYDGKAWAMSEICKILSAHPDLARWGWGVDELQGYHQQVLYVDLPTGQVSFHTDMRGIGPDYPHGWDGKDGMSAQRACAFAAALLRHALETEVSPPADPPDVAHILDLLAWAHSKLRAFGVHTGKPESAMRMDAIELELRSHSFQSNQEGKRP